MKIAKPDKKTICGKNILYLLNMTQQLHVAGLPQVTEDGYFDTANANKSWVRVHGGQSSEFPIYPTTLERTITPTNAKCNHVFAPRNVINEFLSSFR